MSEIIEIFLESEVKSMVLQLIQIDEYFLDILGSQSCLGHSCKSLYGFDHFDTLHTHG